MSGLFVQASDLEEVLGSLHAWFKKVPTQKSRHVWSLLPPKVAGATAGGTINYSEMDDKRFMERFLRVGDGPFPYFDPFSHDWLPEGYFHSNMATFRKKTFINSWRAGDWQGDQLSLDPAYMTTFAEKVLRLAGQTTRLPAFACALWFYKRPQEEWPGSHSFQGGLPEDRALVVAQFRTDFSFTDDAEWEAAFDESSDLDARLRETWGANA